MGSEVMAKIPVGSKVKFASEKMRYTVQASDERFSICTKPFNLKRTVLYSIIDFDEDVRGPENLIFGMGAETRKQCEEMLDRLNGRNPEYDQDVEVYKQAGIDPADLTRTPYPTEVSHRNRCELDIERIDPPKENK
jgi:hypothetical protein